MKTGESSYIFKNTLIVLIFSASVLFSAAGGVSADDIPGWVKNTIVQKESAQVDNPPGYIEKCIYQNRNVFYISSGCCDQYSYLYDENQIKVCAPDGGMDGQGDGKCLDYYNEKKDCKMLWKDGRTWPPMVQ
jgi:hypothetical protein